MKRKSFDDLPNTNNAAKKDASISDQLAAKPKFKINSLVHFILLLFSMSIHNKREVEEPDESINSKRVKSKDSNSNYENDNKNVRSGHDDWPLPRVEISLDIHDLPHESSNIEWWYCNGHLNDNSNNQYSIFASFFRHVDSYRSTCDKTYYLHALAWSIVDVKNNEYYPSSLLDRQFIPRILNGPELSDELDKHLFVAYKEVLHKNNLPLPDRLCTKECFVDLKKLYLNYDDNIFRKDDNGYYHIHCCDTNKNMSLELEMQPLKAVCKQAHDGIVNVGLYRESMFYYFIPRLKANGKITINGKSIHVNGQTWYDHEFGGYIKHNSNSNTSLHNSGSENNATNSDESPVKLSDYGWYWLSIQLDNEYDITVTHLFDIVDNSTVDKSVIIIGPNNERIEYDDKDNIELKPLNNWVSVRTTCAYPTNWKLSIPNMKCELDIEAIFDNQEFLTMLSPPGFWEGRMNINGLMNGQLVKGYGFAECRAYNTHTLKSLDQFFKRISKIVLTNIAKILPRDPTYEQAINLVANQENRHLIDGLDIGVFSKTMLSPIRDITDRGGKAWRSFLLLLCIDCVGGDSSKYEHWLSLAEIVHVGSLIIDDIEDESDIRRGGPACHLLHGRAQAINSGTAAYFLSLHTLIEQTPQLTPELILKMYDTTFLALRAAHVGQAFDIHGLDYIMDDVVETGDSLALEKAILSIHRLKSGVPAGSLARIGAIIGGGTKEQYDALENYVQSIGIAFQIIDDVLNLRGFEENTKMRGEDIMAGKVTFPIAKAMNTQYLNNKIQRKYVWDIIKKKTTDIMLVNDLIQLLEKSSCINESVTYAKSLVEDAWTKFDASIPDSFPKLFLRAFGLYILERHY